jgi:hypothetical protein
VKLFNQESTISQSVDVLLKEIDQGIHSDVKGVLRDKLPGIFKVAGKFEEKRIKDLRSKTDEADKITKRCAVLQQRLSEINREKDVLQQKLDGINEWGEVSRTQSALNRDKILSLLPYIERNPIVPGKEFDFFQAFLDGKNINYLSAFLVKQ